MDRTSRINGLSLHPDKVPDVDDWLAQVRFQPVGPTTDNHFTFDNCGQARAVGDGEHFVQNTLNALAYTQCTAFSSRLCWGACYTFDEATLRAALGAALSSDAIDRALTCHGEALVVAVAAAQRERPGWLANEPISISSFLFRMARSEDAFLDDGGAKWDARTLGIAVTATVSASSQVPPLPMDSPGTTALAKHVRTVVVCNMDVASSRAMWVSVFMQTSALGTELSKLLTLFAQHWQIGQDALLSDAQRVWEWIDVSFEDGEVTMARYVFNAFCAVPFHTGADVVSLEAARKELADEVEYGFHHLATRGDWDLRRRMFWGSMLAMSVEGCTHEQVAYHQDKMFQYIVEEEVALRADDSVAELLVDIKESLEEIESAGMLEPKPRSFVEHLAGETLAQNVLKEDCRIGRVSLEARASSTIELAQSASFVVRLDGKRGKLVVGPGGTLSFQGRDVLGLLAQFTRGINSVSLFSVSLGRNASATPPDLQGSMVGNLVMQGAFGPQAGLWLLSHVLYGDLRVSTASENGLMRALGRDGSGMTIDVDIDAEIVASIHAATDGRRVYLCLSKRKTFLVQRKGALLKGELCDVDVTKMSGCSLKAYRGMC